jgi:hypothetical protein
MGTFLLGNAEPARLFDRLKYLKLLKKNDDVMRRPWMGRPALVRGSCLYLFPGAAVIAT